MFDFINPFKNQVIVERVKLDSVYGAIHNDPDTTIFKHCVNLAGMKDYLESDYNQVTVFVPCDKFLKQIYPPSIFINLDSETALRMVRQSILGYRLPLELIKQSRVSQYWTIGPMPKQMFVTVSSDKCMPPVINNNIFITDDTYLNTSNGIIHKTSDFVFEP